MHSKETSLVLRVALSQFEDGLCLAGSGAAADCLAGRNGAAEAEGGARRAKRLWCPAPRSPGSVSIKNTHTDSAWVGRSFCLDGRLKRRDHSYILFCDEMCC